MQYIALHVAPIILHRLLLKHFLGGVFPDVVL